MILNDERPKMILERLQQEKNERKKSEGNQKRSRRLLMAYWTPLVKAAILTGITLFFYNIIF